MRKKRNRLTDYRRILLICADQLRADALSCYGNSTVRTPNLDRLAEDGCLFRRHYSSATPCGPARASLLTGIYSMNHGVKNNDAAFNQKVPSIAEVLADNGIKSYLIGYTDTVLSSQPGEGINVMPGFIVDTYFNLSQEGLSEWVTGLQNAGYGFFSDRMRAFDPAPSGKYTAIYSQDDSDTAFIANRTIECINKHCDEPWLIHATFLRPHPPWIAPEPYDRFYSPAEIKKPIETNSSETALARILSKTESPAGDSLGIRAVYLGLVAEMDFQIGRIIARLEQLDLRKNTLIIFTSDHGDLLGDHGLFGSSGFYDPAYHIPLIISDPGTEEAGISCDTFTESVDILPTIIKWLGLPEIRSDGFPLLPFSNGHSETVRKAVFLEYDFSFAADTLGIPADDCSLTVWRTRTHKYVNFNGMPPLLFDLLEDPEERFNRASDHPRLISLYSEELVNHAREHRIGE